MDELKDLEEADPFLLNYGDYEYEYSDAINLNGYYKKLGNKYRQMYLSMQRDFLEYENQII